MSKVIEHSPTKYERTYQDNDGTISIWKYDMSKNANGAYSVETIYPKSFKATTQEEDLERISKNVPFSQRKWLAPSGKMVGYARAKSLGLIK